MKQPAHNDFEETSDMMILSVDYQGKERRKTEREWRREVETRLTRGSEVMERTEKKLEENTTITVALKNDTSELLAAFQSAKGAFNTLEIIGRAMKPVALIAGAIASIWGLVASIKSGTPPKL